ncbi:hypothetical protein Clacol_008089 [Clathrus columnatus]|uniref:E3 ubiquitin-protein ligase n=1 Tax=Clathrus columnatus TaxID=1419009 RepID=A0AAV5AGR3_9AGAM|nr:hypothetical protein Clacol_008089 [Clathrus columnatus]
MSLATMKNFLGSINSREKSPDSFTRLRYTVENVLTSKRSYSSSQMRIEVLTALYEAFWGSYAALFLPNASNISHMRTLLSEFQAKHPIYDPPTPGRTCGHIFQKGECCYRCKDCALDDSSVMCSRCFRATQHEGHNVTFYISHQPGGCCDCGDSESWRTRPDCPYHPPSTSRAVVLPSTSKIPDVWSPTRNPSRAGFPTELKDSATRTIAYALDYILDTLDFSPDDAVPPNDPTALRLQQTAEPYENDLYAVLLWNDDKHSFDEVIRNVHEATGAPLAEVTRVINRVDEEGRDIIELNDDIAKLLDVGTRLHQIDLGVTIRRNFDTFREEISSIMIEWILDLTRCRVGTDTTLLRELINSELLHPRKKGNSLYHPQLKSYTEVDNPARLDWLFLYHTRLWKKPRLNLKQLYVSLITLSPEHKLAIASHFAAIFHRIIDSFLLIDREAETSVKYFALQLFTVPSIAAYIVRNHGIIPRLLAIITAFSTEQIEDTRIVFPPDPSRIVDPESKAFKSKRFMPVFADLRYLCSNSTVQEIIVQNRDFIVGFCKMCQMFMGINPNQRVKQTHVEYESDTWINVFNVTLSLSRAIKAYGEAYSKASVSQLVDAITTVVQHTMSVCTLREERLDRLKYRSIIPHVVEFNNATYKIVKFDVLEGWISFHQGLHWLLAELFKHVELLGPESLQTVGYRNLRDVLLRNSGDLDILTLIDFPLRVITMVAQIRAGLWVRNGFAVRGQLLHYRDFMLRELCYDQDLFILQSAFVVLDPNIVLVSILDRFQLMGWFSGDATSPVYDDNQLSCMIEELLYVIITCLSEYGNAKHLSLQGAIRRELIHALAVGPCGFTDICKRVSERMVEDVSFESTLSEISTFKPPETTTDAGVYELKDKFYDEINPYFYHYARNKREEVEVILKTRAKKRNLTIEFVYVPQPLNIRTGPFITLSNTFQSTVLHQVIFFAIHNVLRNQGQMTSVYAEAILDQALHLVMLGLVEQPRAFSRLSSTVTYKRDNDYTLVEVLCLIEHNDIYKALKSKIQWCLDKLATYEPSAVMDKRKILDSEVKDLTDDTKKRAAKARQDAIMKQFAAAQKSFLENFDDEEEDDEMEDANDPNSSFQSFGPCIVCQEALDNTRPFGTLGFIQASKLLRYSPDHSPSSQSHLNNVLISMRSWDRATPLDEREKKKPTFPFPEEATQMPFNAMPRSNLRFGMHGSSCGHMMHINCFATYASAVRQRHKTQAQRNHPEQIQRKEFICPLCKSLGNVILPVTSTVSNNTNTLSFPDWVRTTGINLLRSTPDRLMESLHFKSGSGEFVFWTAQDFGYQSYPRNADRFDPADIHKMLDTVMIATRIISSQSRHLRERMEQEPGERGVGMYLPEDLIAYTIASTEVSLRGVSTLPGKCIADQLTEFQVLFIRGLITCLTKLAALQFRDRADGGKETVRQAIVKRLLPEWRREPPFNSPLLLRDPFTILIEMSAVSPESLRYVTILTYYAAVARITIGIVQALIKVQHLQLQAANYSNYRQTFGTLGTFVMSVVRHSNLLEHTAELVLEAFGEERFAKLLYNYSLPFLRKAVLLRKAVHPLSLSATPVDDNLDEYGRLLHVLGIPPLAELSNYDTIQNALSGWCAHYGFMHGSHPLDCNIPLEYPIIYHLAQLPPYLDDLFGYKNTEMVCTRCDSVPTDPAICLICGATVCFSSHCCADTEYRSRGECNRHTRECAGVIGAYFVPKRCTVLYLFDGSGSFASAPFLDAHGEVDHSLRRGRRQIIHDIRYEEIRKLWLNHNIPSYITRKMDATIDVGGWEQF